MTWIVAINKMVFFFLIPSLFSIAILVCLITTGRLYHLSRVACPCSYRHVFFVLSFVCAWLVVRTVRSWTVDLTIRAESVQSWSCHFWDRANSVSGHEIPNME